MVEVLIKKGNRVVPATKVAGKPKPSGNFEVTERDRALFQSKQKKSTDAGVRQERRPLTLRQQAEAGTLTSRQAAMLRS